MPSTETLNLDLRELAKAGKPVTLSLHDDFFKGLDQEEINGGDIQVELAVREAAGEVFVVSVAVSGEVVVMCDRCLDDLTLPVDVEEEIKIYTADNDLIPDNDDVRMLEGRDYKYDFGWDIYEITELSLPLQRVHKENECNPEMTDRLANLK